MGRILEFEWMNGDTPMSHVWAYKTEEGVIVDCEDYTDSRYDTFFGKCPKTVDSIIKLFRLRCFEDTRPDVNELLGMIGLTQYSPLDIVMKTEGRTVMDERWVRWIIKPDAKNV